MSKMKAHIIRILKFKYLPLIIYSSLILFIIANFFRHFITFGELSVYTTDSELWLLRFAAIVRLLVRIVVISLIYIIYLGKFELHRLYIIVGISFGLFYMILISPLSAPDEEHHYNSIVRITNMISNPFRDNEYVNKRDFDFNELFIQENFPQSYLRLRDPIFHSGDQTRMPQPEPFDSHYPVHYMPQILGFGLARILQLNFIWAFFMSRFFNLLFFVICVSIAIQKMPFHKELIFLVALLPIVVQQAASLSSDSYINGLSILVFACLMKSIYAEGQMSRRELLWLLIPLGLLGPAKIIYIALALFLILIPKERFPLKYQAYKWKILMIASTIIPAILIGIPRFFELTTIQHTDGLDQGYNYTLGFILGNPLEYFMILIRTIQSNFQIYIETLIGSHLSGWSLPIPSYIVYTFIVILLLIALKPIQATREVTICYRIVALLISAFVFVAVLTTMMIAFTTYGMNVILGVQGRYFVPILLPILLMFHNKVLIIHKDMNRYLLMIACLLTWRTLEFVLFFTLIRV